LPRGNAILKTIVGVGDSLTAGYQAGGFLGATNVKNPLVPGTIVPPTQESGFWADLDEQASGLPIPAAIAREYDPATSPLPLVAGPGLNNQLIAAPPPTPFGLLKAGDACTDNNGFNAQGYLLSGNRVTRLNPSSRSIRDVGVPGMTLHEGNTLFAPQTNTCTPLPGTPGLLSLIVDGEASVFWPVLGNFANMGTNLSDVNAAASLHPTLATVWFGANDVLKYMGSGGRFVGGDQNSQQVEADIVQAVQTLQNVNARVVVANLPNVLKSPYFLRVSLPKKAAYCNVQTYVYCLLHGLGFPPSHAAQLTAQVAAMYHLATPNGCAAATVTKPCGYLTLQGALTSLQYYLATQTLPNLDCAPPTYSTGCVPGSGIGTYYITPGFASKIQNLNNFVNNGIDEAAHALSIPEVSVKDLFDGIASGDPANPYFVQAASINPGVCCTLSAGAGLISYDGLHPSNTGYALIAYYFIKAINDGYHTNIPEIDVRAAYQGTRCSNKRYCFPDPYAKH
jgi:lysophospholipase L1-like esterase